MKYKTENTEKLKLILLVLLYLTVISPSYLYYEQIKGVLSSFKPLQTLNSYLGIPTFYYYIIIIVLTILLILSIVTIFIIKSLTAKPLINKIQISLKSFEITAVAEDYKIIKEYKSSLLPGFRKGIFRNKLIAALYFLFALIPAFEGNYIIVAFFYSLPFFVFGIQGVVNIKLRKTDFVIKLVLLFCFAAILSASAYFTAIAIKYEYYKSPFLMKALCSTPGILRTINLTVDEELFYEYAGFFDNESTLPLLKKGELLKRKGDQNGAKEAYQYAVLIDSTSVEAYFQLSKLYEKEGRTDKALKLLRKVQLLNPSYAPSFYEEARILLKTNEFDKAEIQINKAIGVNKNEVQYHLLKANILKAQKKYEAADLELKKAIDLKPGKIISYTERAKLLLEDKKFDEVQLILKSALTLNPNDPESNYLKGILMLKQNNFSEAALSFKKALSLKPDFLLAEGYLASALFESGDEQGAINKLDDALLRGSNIAELHFIKASQLNYKSSFNDAIKEIDRAILLDNNQAEYYCLKAHILLQQSKTNEIEYLLTKAASIDERDENIYFIKGMYLIWLGNYEAANAVLDKCLLYNPYLSNGYALKAITENALNDREKSDENLEKALDFKPGDFYNYYIKSIVYFNRQLNTQALTAINKAIELNDTNADVYLQKYDILNKLGLETEKNAALDKAISLSPEKCSVLLKQSENDIFDLYAINEIDRFISSFSDNYQLYLSKALRFLNLKRFNEANGNIDSAIAVNKDSFLPYLLKYRVLREQSNSLINNSLDSEMIKVLDKMAEINKYFPDTFYFKGLLLNKQKKYSEAIAEFNKAAGMEINYAESIIKKSIVYDALSNTFKALNMNDKAEEQHKNMEKAKIREDLQLIK